MAKRRRSISATAKVALVSSGRVCGVVAAASENLPWAYLDAFQNRFSVWLFVFLLVLFFHCRYFHLFFKSRVSEDSTTRSRRSEDQIVNLVLCLFSRSFARAHRYCDTPSSSPESSRAAGGQFWQNGNAEQPEQTWFSGNGCRSISSLSRIQASPTDDPLSACEMWLAVRHGCRFPQGDKYADLSAAPQE